MRSRPQVLLFPLATLAVTAAVTVWLAPQIIPMPGRESVVVPFGMLLPVLPATGVAAVAGWQLRATADKRALSVALPLLLTAMALAATAATSVRMAGDITWVGATRNSALLCGLGLLAAACLRTAWSWVVPAGYVVLLLGEGVIDGSVTAWKLPLYPDQDTGVMALSVTVLVCGIAAVITRAGSRRPAATAA
ncbi:MAG: hypothetical protein ACTHMZ_00960 [Actinomycetes bacterium]